MEKQEKCLVSVDRSENLPQTYRSAPSSPVDHRQERLFQVSGERRGRFRHLNNARSEDFEKVARDRLLFGLVEQSQEFNSAQLQERKEGRRTLVGGRRYGRRVPALPLERLSGHATLRW